MAYINSFSAIATPYAKVLILGSIPGKASLMAEQYYAHPRNQFWPIMAELLTFEPNASYQSRIQSISNAGVALWDVVNTCERLNSSLDAKINANSIITNDFAEFFLQHPLLTYVFFNGTTAEKTFHKHVLPGLWTQQLIYQRLPSTSPAHASKTFEEKLAEWRILIACLTD